MRSVTSDSAAAWTVARQAPLSVEFPRKEYWSGDTAISYSRESSQPLQMQFSLLNGKELFKGPTELAQAQVECGSLKYFPEGFRRHGMRVLSQPLTTELEGSKPEAGAR